MKNGVFPLSVMVSALCTSLMYGMQQHRSHGVPWKRDQFGNILPNLQGISTHELSATLAAFVAQLKDAEKGNAFIVWVPHEEAEKIPYLKFAGFLPHHIDGNGTQWIIKNGSPMPEASTASAGARVIICKGGDALVIEDKNMPGRLMFPGGSVDAHELARDAACREVEEEVGLVITPQHLKKIAEANRVSANRYGFSDYCHYYVTCSFDGGVRPQEKEISQVFWHPLDDIARGGPVKGLKVSPTAKLLAAHVLEGGEGKSVRMLDPRQYSFAADKQDRADCMDIELFHIFAHKEQDEHKQN